MLRLETVNPFSTAINTTSNLTVNSIVDFATFTPLSTTNPTTNL